VQGVGKDFIVRYTHNTTALEGNTLTLQETQVVIESGLVIEGKPLREHLEVVNVVDALHHVDDLVADPRPLTEDDVRDLHALLMQKLVDRPGAYRTERVLIVGATHVPPNPRKVPDAMAELAACLNEPVPGEPHVAHAARVHHRLAQIHPWTDGNGRTARLLTSVLTMRAGYPPPLYEAKERYLYLEALSHADLGDLGELTEMTARAIEVALLQPS
jgi:Fic family protein